MHNSSIRLVVDEKNLVSFTVDAVVDGRRNEMILIVCDIIIFSKIEFINYDCFHLHTFVASGYLLSVIDSMKYLAFAI